MISTARCPAAAAGARRRTRARRSRAARSAPRAPRGRRRARAAASGYGSSQTVSTSGGSSSSQSLGRAGSRPAAASPAGARIAFRQALVAIRYSQARSELRASKRRQPAPGAQQRVLQRVLGVVHRAEHAVAVGVQLRAVGLEQAAECILVALLGGREQRALLAGRVCGSRAHPREHRPQRRPELIARRRDELSAFRGSQLVSTSNRRRSRMLPPSSWSLLNGSPARPAARSTTSRPSSGAEPRRLRLRRRRRAGGPERRVLAVKAAVCHAFGEPLVVEELELDPPRPGEVRVRVAACSICHSDVAYASGAWGGRLPAVYGHEAAGVVEEVGGAAGGLRPGDHVVVTLVRSCGSCHVCRRGQPALCATSVRARRAQPAAHGGRRRDRAGPAHGGVRRARARAPLPGRRRPARAAARSRLPAGLRRRHRLRRRRQHARS